MDPLARILDANANRAREGLRTLEDVARFGLDDAGLCAELKILRHDLAAALADLPIDYSQRLAARDTPGDVGAAISTQAEARRDNLPAIAAAAAGRVTEALRVIEETAKALGAPHVAGRVEAARYRAYTAEQRIIQALGTGRARQWRLCVLITESLCTHHPWEDVARLALEGGADCVQLREKSLDSRELLDRACRLIALARPRGAAVIVNDRPDIALLAGADGVHVGQTDLDIRSIRALAGGRLLVGVSTSSIEEAGRAARDGADYLGLGPMFSTTTKLKERLAGPAYARDVFSDPMLAARPHLAIGGITPANVAQVASSGVRGIAVSSAVCSSQDPSGACAALTGGLVAGLHGARESIRRTPGS